MTDALRAVVLAAHYGLPASLLPPDTVAQAVREAVAILREHEPEALVQYAHLVKENPR
jgi:hypothetical protein